MSIRVEPGVIGSRKARREESSLDRCLAGVGPIKSVCDVPAGPGRLFAYWRQRGMEVHGFDLSEEMAEAAATHHHALGLKGETGLADAFEIGDRLAERVDLVASIRFMYYFDSEQRIALWRALADASRRFILAECKSSETLSGQIDQQRAQYRRRRKRHLHRRTETFAEIAQEVALAGLRLVRIVPASEFSTRVYVLAEKPHVPEPTALAPLPRRHFLMKPVARLALAAHSLWLSLRHSSGLRGAEQVDTVQ